MGGGGVRVSHVARVTLPRPRASLAQVDISRFGLRLSVTAHALSRPSAAPLVHLERELAHAAALSVAYNLDLFEPEAAGGAAAKAGSAAGAKGPAKGGGCAPSLPPSPPLAASPPRPAAAAPGPSGGMREILGWSWNPIPSAGADVDGVNVKARGGDELSGPRRPPRPTPRAPSSLPASRARRPRAATTPRRC